MRAGCTRTVVRNRGSLAVGAIGATLLVASVGHHLREVSEVDGVVGPAVALALDGGLACALMYAGWWLERADLLGELKRSVGRWTAAGGVAGGVLALLTVGAQVVEGRNPPEPVFQTLVTIGAVAALSFVAGYYSVTLRQTTRRYRSVFNGTFQFTGLLRPDKTVVAVNDTALRFGGLDREEVVDRPFPDVSWWTHSEAVHERVHDALDRATDGEFVRYETNVQGADGLRTIDFSAKPVDDAGDASLIVVEGRDITARRRRRQHLQVLQRIIRHNVRNDVTKLRGWTEQLAAATDPDERGSHARRVRRILNSWHEMADKLSRVQKLVERDRSEYRTVAVESLVTETVGRQQEAHPEAEIAASLPETSPGAVPVAVGGAIDEAIDNAVEAVTDGRPEVTVAAAADDDWVEIEVASDGPEMPDIEASVLETGEETPLSHGRGTGVWMIRMLVTQSGGKIAVDTTDAGTTLTFRIPEGDAGIPGAT
jgi:PAS domain S-box-containing protein